MNNQSIPINLAGMRVMVTRPDPAGQVLCDKISACGGIAYHFPTMVIQTLAASEDVQAQVQCLDDFDYLIFISPQSVYAIAKTIRQRWPTLPESVKLLAVGAGTAAALEAEHLPVWLYPADDWSSEGLMALSELNAVQGKKIGLIQGANPRAYLYETLSHRGAMVTPITAYQRLLPTSHNQTSLQLIHNDAVDVIVCTSGEGVQNLKTLLMQQWQKLQSLPIVVISEKQLELARDLQFKQIFLANNASHDAIIEWLVTFRNDHGK
jgi:uroporphyrinogen-III synthase